MYYKLKVLIKILFLGFLYYPLYSQESQAFSAENFQILYELTEKKYGVDQQLSNGVYFEDVYRNTNRHPYLLDDTFHEGTLVYQNKDYKGVQLKYDIYAQQVLVHHQLQKYTITTVLTDEFLTEFSIQDQYFKKMNLIENKDAYYQVIAENEHILCCYYCLKRQNEDFQDNVDKLYTFSDVKREKYLVLDAGPYKYKNNRSFNKIFPKDMKGPIRKYLRSNNIKVRKANDGQVAELIDFCENLISNGKM